MVCVCVQACVYVTISQTNAATRHKNLNYSVRVCLKVTVEQIHTLFLHVEIPMRAHLQEEHLAYAHVSPGEIVKFILYLSTSDLCDLLFMSDRRRQEDSAMIACNIKPVGTMLVRYSDWGNISWAQNFTNNPSPSFWTADYMQWISLALGTVGKMNRNILRLIWMYNGVYTLYPSGNFTLQNKTIAINSDLTLF